MAGRLPGLWGLEGKGLPVVMDHLRSSFVVIGEESGRRTQGAGMCFADWFVGP